MTNPTTQREPLTKLDGRRLFAFGSKLDVAGITKEDGEAVLSDRSGQHAAAMSKALKASLAGKPLVEPATPVDPFSGLFTPIPLVVMQVRALNRCHGLGFSEAEITAFEASAPSCHPGGLVACVPMVAANSLSKTVNTLWKTAAELQSSIWDWRWNSPLFKEKDVRLTKNREFIPHQLRWTTVDLAANRNQSPRAVLETASPEPCAVLAAAAFHPLWMKGIDGENVPDVWETGFECLIPNGPWHGLDRYAFFDTSSCFKWVSLNPHDPGHGRPSHAVPVSVYYPPKA